MPRLSVALLALVPLAVAAPVPKAKKADPFPFAVGTKWEYSHDGEADVVWTEEVAECVEKDGVVTFTVNITAPGEGKRFETYRLKEGELVITATQEGTFDPPMLIAKAGMKAGDEWATKWALKSDGFEVAFEETLTVGKAEEVKTPAGTFTATPVTRKGMRRSTVFWFADGVGMVRQTADGQKEPAQELKAFTPGKK